MQYANMVYPPTTVARPGHQCPYGDWMQSHDESMAIECNEMKDEGFSWLCLPDIDYELIYPVVVKHKQVLSDTLLK